MDNEEVALEEQMDRTRANLTKKLEALEGQVSETVQSTTAAVSNTVEAVKETVESVKETVQGTVEAVKESVQGTVSAVSDTVEGTVRNVADAFDLRLQVERHPWMMLGGAVAVGCLAGAWSRSADRSARPVTPPTRQPESTPENGAYREPVRATATPPSFVSQGLSQGANWLWGELGRFKGLGVGLVMSVVRDMARKELPGEFGEKVAEQIDSLTTRLGGEPVHLSEALGGSFAEKTPGMRSANFDEPMRGRSEATPSRF